MGRRVVDHDMATYSAMIAHRLRQLREGKSWSMDEFRIKLAEHKVVGKDGLLIPESTAYSYETGKAHSGATLPVDHFPVIARIYGFDHPAEWLPQNWPGEGALIDDSLPCP